MSASLPFAKTSARGEIGQHRRRSAHRDIYLSSKAWLLCFDEFHVTDIADAMILGRLFARLFELGTVVVATSNVPPENLYEGDLNRVLFLPFIAQIEERMDVLRLDARTDFRMEKLASVKMWLTPADAEAEAALDRAWTLITGGAPCKPRDIAIKGRLLHVPCSAHGVARFSFADLCEQPLAASDYLRLARDYHTLMIDHIPMMDYDDRNAAKRFIALIDALYDNGVKLMASSDSDPLSLYRANDGFEANQFKRTSSRAVRRVLPGPEGRHRLGPGRRTADLLLGAPQPLGPRPLHQGHGDRGHRGPRLRRGPVAARQRARRDPGPGREAEQPRR